MNSPGGGIGIGFRGSEEGFDELEGGPGGAANPDSVSAGGDTPASPLPNPITFLAFKIARWC
jgi:hypothetical protein